MPPQANGIQVMRLTIQGVLRPWGVRRAWWCVKHIHSCIDFLPIYHMCRATFVTWGDRFSLIKLLFKLVLLSWHLFFNVWAVFPVEATSVAAILWKRLLQHQTLERLTKLVTHRQTLIMMSSRGSLRAICRAQCSMTRYLCRRLVMGVWYSSASIAKVLWPPITDRLDAVSLSILPIILYSWTGALLLNPAGGAMRSPDPNLL